MEETVKKRITIEEKKRESVICAALPMRAGRGGFITITSAAQPKAILLPLFQLSSCHLQNIMHFGFFYANFFFLGGTIFFPSPSYPPFNNEHWGHLTESFSWHGPWGAPSRAKSNNGLLL